MTDTPITPEAVEHFMATAMEGQAMTPAKINETYDGIEATQRANGLEVCPLSIAHLVSAQLAVPLYQVHRALGWDMETMR